MASQHQLLPPALLARCSLLQKFISYIDEVLLQNDGTKVATKCSTLSAGQDRSVERPCP